MGRSPKNGNAVKPVPAAFLPTLLLIIVGAVLFGLRLGPQQKENRPASPLAATLAAQGFVRAAVAKRATNNVTFPTDAGGASAVTAVPDATDLNLWTVTGTATAGAAALQWTVQERWDGVHNWRLKAVEVVGPKQNQEAMP